MDVYACDHTKELIIKAHNNDKSAREKLVIDNSGLVWSIVKRFTGRGAEMEDLYQIGCIGLIKAIDNFNMDYDVKFSTYAVPMIIGEIKRFLRDDGIVKVSRSLKEASYKIKREKEQKPIMTNLFSFFSQMKTFPHRLLQQVKVCFIFVP